MTEPRVTARVVDCGAKIGVAVEFGGKRRAVLIDNPLWPEIDAEWKQTHEGEG